MSEKDLKKEFLCQYCGSKFKTKTNLSKHIDRIHMGSGLLEGDARNW
ncbi:MAG: hypothetical protein QF381_02790 [Nitrososphaerales archaeon]|jgi:5-methylcytosine-specific restriction endonuclease McrA|nr:hypothetical protein [Nitrososphaerales archaeon]HJN58347.1 hypothetical protein [Nitrososphaerales archaeon]|tara:strand:+ start:9451 stop:9591 length:141 start_codon:yes stop_codon:yes gene_type:complete